MSHLRAHVNRIPGVLPDLEYLMKHVLVDEINGNHWFFNENRPNHRFNRWGQPIIRWRVKVKASTMGRTQGEYVVARALIEHRTGELLLGVIFHSVCGLSQCVNPDHWQRFVKPNKWRMHVSQDHDWGLVSVRDGVRAKRDVLVNLRFYDAIHVAAIAPITHRGIDVPLRAMCGMQLDPSFVSTTNDAPTCRGCS